MQPARLKCPIGLHKIDKAGKGEIEIFLHGETQFMLPKNLELYLLLQNLINHWRRSGALLKGNRGGCK